MVLRNNTSVYTYGDPTDFAAIKSNIDQHLPALDITDHIFGKNATGYGFVTGFGSKSPMQPHHRVMSPDGIDEPIPGRCGKCRALCVFSNDAESSNAAPFSL